MVLPAMIFTSIFFLGLSRNGLPAMAQSTPPCVVKLVPCYNFLNSTAHVPDSCCKPMKEVVSTQKECLCKLYDTPGLLQSYNINITQVFALAKACGVTASTSLCTVSAGAGSPSSAPQGIPGKDGNGGARGTAPWTGLLSFQMLWGLIVMLR